jgi:hypothetical protein
MQDPIFGSFFIDHSNTIEELAKQQAQNYISKNGEHIGEE